MTNNKPLIVIPEITKPKILAAEAINSTSGGLIILTLLLAQRAQISSSLPQYQKQDIQQLESIKWNAKQIAKTSIIRNFVVQLVLADTINYEMNKIKSLSKEEIDEYINYLAKDLVQSSPNRDAKILHPRAINQSNIKSHRLALIARYIGIWQARPIFEPYQIIKNHPAQALNAEQLSDIIFELHNTFDINLDSRLNELISSKLSKEEALITFIKEYFKDNMQDEKIIFSDIVNFKSVNNITPIEKLMPFIERPIPDTLISGEDFFSTELLANPLFNYGNNVNNTINKENKRLGLFKSSLNKSEDFKLKSKPKTKFKPSSK